MEFFPSSLRILYVYIKLENTANKLGFYGKSLFLTHKYLGETGFAEFAFVSPDEFSKYSRKSAEKLEHIICS